MMFRRNEIPETTYMNIKNKVFSWKSKQLDENKNSNIIAYLLRGNFSHDFDAIFCSASLGGNFSNDFVANFFAVRF